MNSIKCIYKAILFFQILFMADLVSAQVIREVRFPNGGVVTDRSGDDFMVTYVGPLAVFADGLQSSFQSPSPLMQASNGSGSDVHALGSGWIPLGIMKNPISKNCMVRSLDRRLREQVDSRDFAAELNEYFADCGRELVYQHGKGLGALYDFLKVEYPFYDLPNLKKVQFVFEDETVLEGFVAVKDQQPRPWVIVKCGVFCSAGDGFTSRNFLIALYDQAPFNVIFVGNRTGIDYIRQNRALTAGGYNESHDFFEVARWLREKSQWASKDLEVHGIGVSLGGSAALYTAELEPTYRKASASLTTKFFNSITAICPAVDIHATLDRMFASPIKGAIVGQFAWNKINEALPYLDLSDGIFVKNQKPSNAEMAAKVGQLSARYGAQWGQSPYYKRSLPPITNVDEEWTYNDFIRYSEHHDVTPLLVWASRDDGLVANDVNSQLLENSPIIKKNANIGVVNVEYGDHCGLATSYGFPTVSSVLRNFIVAHSPRYQDQLTQRGSPVQRVKYNFDFKNFDFTNATLLRHWWRVVPDEESAHLIFEFFDKKKNKLCPFSDPEDENTIELCRTYLDARIPLVDLMKFVGIPANIKTAGEAHHWTRRLNYLAQVAHDRQMPEWTSLVPNEIEFLKE